MVINNCSAACIHQHVYILILIIVIELGNPFDGTGISLMLSRTPGVSRSHKFQI